MRVQKGSPALDQFRLAAAVLVIFVHTSPLLTYTEIGDFWLARILARLAVPFFLMLSGYFLAQNNWRSTGAFCKKLLLIYICSILLYLPLNLYNGAFTPIEWMQKLLIDGTFYHLWYFPAVLLGVVIARALVRLGLPKALLLAAALYLIGLGGDSYYGLVSQIPAIESAYKGIFTVFTYTRNGLFLAPLFLLLGAAKIQLDRKSASIGFVISFLLMSVEGLTLHHLDFPRHDSMYITLPLCMIFLFSLLRSANRGRDRKAADLSLLIYVIHPWCIVLVRGGAKVLGLQALFVKNSLGHFVAVLLSSLLLALLLYRLRPMRPYAKGRAWREIDLDAAAHNARQLQSALAPGCHLMAVLKADAYGHDAVLVARRLRREGVKSFAVACLAEGVALRKHGITGQILILGYTAPEQAPLLARWHLTQTVTDKAHGIALSAQKVPVRVHLALDTGMHRLGIPAQDHNAIARMYKLPYLHITGIFSHLCVSDSAQEQDTAYTRAQLDLFYDTIHWLEQSGYAPGDTHIQASYGIWNLPPQPCSSARAGIALYGVASSLAAAPQQRLDLRPVLSLRARVALVRTLPAGQGAGYDLAFRADTERRIAVVTIGYADGIPRDLSARSGRVLLAGQFCPIVGRICMDQLLIDVTALPEVSTGDIVTFIGRDGQAEIRAEELADRCGTLTNELLSRMGARLPSVTVHGETVLP